LSEGKTAAIQAPLRRIHALGLCEGKRLCLIARGPFSGPLLVEDVGSGARVMIARDLAGCIDIAREDDPPR